MGYQPGVNVKVTIDDDLRRVATVTVPAQLDEQGNVVQEGYTETLTPQETNRLEANFAKAASIEVQRNMDLGSNYIQQRDSYQRDDRINTY